MSLIRECFISRWDGGNIVEVDFSQLEVLVQAILTKCPTLIRDIVSGKDMHTLRAAELFRVNTDEVSAKQRQIAKALSFQLAYGARPKKMAQSLGVTEEIASTFYNNFFKRYPEIETYNTLNRTLLEKTSKPMTTGEARMSVLNTFIGRTYTFIQSEFKGKYTFSPTDVSNYPVQGTASDIVAVFRANLYRALPSIVTPHSPDILLIGTVHDSVVFDVQDTEALTKLLPLLDCTVQFLPHILREWIPELEIPVVFKADVKCGKSWLDQIQIAHFPTGKFA